MSASQEATKPAVIDGGLTFLEQLQEARSAYCTNPASPVMLGTDAATGKRTLYVARCKMWSCSSCAARKSAYWLARLINGINELGDAGWHLLTITLPGYVTTLEASLRQMRKCSKRLHERMRYYNQMTPYARTWELHSDDQRIHAHYIIQNGFGTALTSGGRYRSAWLKKHAPACGLGHQVDCRPIDNAGQAAGYVAKYLMKDALPNASIWPRGVRRVECSRGWPPLPSLNEDDDDSIIWEYVGQKVALLDICRKHGLLPSQAEYAKRVK